MQQRDFADPAGLGSNRRVAEPRDAHDAITTLDEIPA
jgi:hypothetical protein